MAVPGERKKRIGEAKGSKGEDNLRKRFARVVRRDRAETGWALRKWMKEGTVFVLLVVGWNGVSLAMGSMGSSGEAASSTAVVVPWGGFGSSGKSQSTIGLLRAAAAIVCSPMRLSVRASMAARLPPMSWPQTPRRGIFRRARPHRATAATVLESLMRSCRTQSYADKTSWIGVG